jgi:hypothetical protein
MGLALPYELRVGVTGHRQLADEPAVARAVERLLNHITATLNRASAAPLLWTVVSPLAKGADRIVADAVLARSNARLQVITPLPMPDYRTDFVEAADLQEFERLLARASSVHELGERATTGVTPTVAEGAERNIAYFLVGEQVVDACEILICIWNGGPAKGVGGTAEIVQYALQRERTVLWIHADRPDAAAAFVTSVKDPDLAKPDKMVVQSAPLPTVAKRLSRGYHQQAAYTADTSLGQAFCSTQEPLVVQPLQKVATASGLPAACLEAVLAPLAGPYVRADLLAMLYQKRYTHATNAVLYLAASAVTAAVAQVLFFPAQPWLILFEVVAMLAVFVVWWYSRREAWHEKWLHDRYLAEQLRGAMFLTLLVAPSRDTAREDPLPFYPGPQQWIELTVAILAQAAANGLPPVPFDPLKRFLLNAWLRDQQTFHTGNAKRKARRAERRHLLGTFLFGATLLMASLHLAGVGHQTSDEVARLLRPDLWITFFVLVLPVWAAAIHAVSAQLELHRIAARSTRMAHMLDWLAHRAERARTLPELREVALEAAELMAKETREWWALLSFQDVKLHV